MLFRLHVVVLLLACSSLALAADPPAPYTARVVGVSDGDTLTVLRADKTQVKVRLWGVDAPETGQDFGAKAKQATSDLVFGKDVWVMPRDTDRYGRTVAEVRLPDGRWLGQTLVRGGWAWWYKQYAPKDSQLAALEQEARQAKAGLWAGPSPVAPWDWRKPKAADPAAGVVGNSNSHVYHLSNCRSVAKMSDKNKVAFGSPGDAEAAGYKKAGDCGNGR